MKVNVNDTQGMLIEGHAKQVNININRETLEQVKEFKYLCAIIEDTGNRYIETERRNKPAQWSTAISYIKQAILIKEGGCKRNQTNSF